ncbi:MAG: septum formation initiator family protein [Deltaproteobacteria bacterium]|nr:septum formation initiator family protein [Deltaproteobacteria bacterium]
MRISHVILGGLLLLVSALLLLQTLLEPEGWGRHQKARADLEALRAENGRLESEVSELRRQIEALRTRAEVQEHVIRDELGFIRPGEVTLEVEHKP